MSSVRSSHHLWRPVLYDRSHDRSCERVRMEGITVFLSEARKARRLVASITLSHFQASSSVPLELAALFRLTLHSQKSHFTNEQESSCCLVFDYRLLRIASLRTSCGNLTLIFFPIPVIIILTLPPCIVYIDHA